MMTESEVDHVFVCIIFCLGIGSSRNLNFNDAEGYISWDPPQTAGVLGNMSYQLVVINNNTGQVIVNTTTMLTSHYFPFEPCQDYVGKVTAHVGDIAGETVVQEYRTLGGECLIVSLFFCPPCHIKGYKLIQVDYVRMFHF